MRTFKLILGTVFILRALGSIAGLIMVFMRPEVLPSGDDGKLFGAVAGGCVFMALGGWLIVSAWQKR